MVKKGSVWSSSQGPTTWYMGGLLLSSFVLFGRQYLTSARLSEPAARLVDDEAPSSKNERGQTIRGDVNAQGEDEAKRSSRRRRRRRRVVRTDDSFTNHRHARALSSFPFFGSQSSTERTKAFATSIARKPSTATTNAEFPRWAG